MLRSIYLTSLYHRSLHKLFSGDIFYQLYDLSDLILGPFLAGGREWPDQPFSYQIRNLANTNPMWKQESNESIK